VYSDFQTVLAKDIASTPAHVHSANQANKTLRRLGFTPLPLVCVLIASVQASFDASSFTSATIFRLGFALQIIVS
jgi:hypothetical protein